MHDESPQVNATAFDVLFGVHFESVVLEKWTSGQADVSKDSRNTGTSQRRFHSEIKPRRNATTGKSGVSEQEVEVTVLSVGGEACKNTIALGDNGVKGCETLAPAIYIRRRWRPCGDLLRRIEWRGQRTNRGGIKLGDARQIVRFVGSFLNQEQ